MEYLLTTHHLTKTYGRHKAVDGVSLHLRQGDIYGLIGRNGAGKTTLLKLLSGLAAPTAGDFTLFGATGRHARAYLSRVGTLIEAPGIDHRASEVRTVTFLFVLFLVQLFPLHSSQR